jgi:ATP synthase I chain
MDDIAQNPGEASFSASDDKVLQTRLLRAMIVTVSLAVIAGATFAPWRVATGLFLGGVLSLFNHHWLRTSTAAAFKIESGKRPRVKVWRYVVRYMVIAATVVAAYKLNIVSLPATIVGLSTFVVAVFAEAFRSFYFTLFHREEY